LCILPLVFAYKVRYNKFKENKQPRSHPGCTSRKDEIIMKINLFWNQYYNGGAVVRELWQLGDDSNYHNDFGGCETLERVTVDLPSGWTVADDFAGDPALFDAHGNILIICGDRSRPRVRTESFQTQQPTKYYNLKICK
jgi:hypothetical protein